MKKSTDRTAKQKRSDQRYENRMSRYWALKKLTNPKQHISTTNENLKAIKTKKNKDELEFITKVEENRIALKIFQTTPTS
jgi:hypothetical protein